MPKREIIHGRHRPEWPTDGADRFAWLRDVRTALERHQIGSTAWEYAGGFGWWTGQRVVHEQTARPARRIG